MTILDDIPGGGYSTTQQVRTFANVVLANVSDDQLEEFIAAADNWTDDYTGKTWRKTIVNGELIDADAYTFFKTTHYPILEITKLEVYENDQWTEKTEWDPVTRTGDYRIYKAASGIIEWVNTTPASGRDKIRIGYKAGYETVPDKIRDLSMRLATITALQADSGHQNPNGYKSISEGDLTISWGNGAHDTRIQDLVRETKEKMSQLGGKLNYAFSR